MRFKSSKIIASVAVIGAVAAGGAAFTASNTINSAQTVAGYSSTSISGATISTLTYDQSTDPAQIDKVDVTFLASQTGKVVTAGFNATGLLTITCEDTASAGLVYTCTPASPQPTSGASQFRMSVTG